MKNKYYIISLFLLSILFFNFSFGFVNSYNDDNIDVNDDNDKLNDAFKEVNKRDIEIDIGENEIHVESTRRSDVEKDQINVLIAYDEDGISIGIKYKSKFEAESEFELVFGISFREIIEFVDIEDEDGNYYPEFDHTVQKLQLNNFKPVIYENLSISSDSTLHCLKIQAKNNAFTAHIYFVEEFAVIENSLITPTQMKIDIAISNFDYMNESSQLALYTKLDSEVDFEEEDVTNDEKDDYSSNEKGIITTINNYTGFFTWKENADIDEISKKISVSEIVAGEHGQKLYINYPRGEHIYHESKLGIEGLLKSIDEPSFPTDLIILMIVIGAISTSVAYSAYYVIHTSPTKKRKRDREKYFRKNFQKEKLKEPYNGKLAILMLEEENAIEKLSQIENINITILPEDFFEIINRFEWEENEKSEFINEMLALSPYERKLILEEMLKRSNLIKWF